MTIHTFASTSEAYTQSMARGDIKIGDLLLIPSENVVGIAWAWPLAITRNHGQLHKAKPGDATLISILQEIQELQEGGK